MNYELHERNFKNRTKVEIFLFFLLRNCTKELSAFGQHNDDIFLTFVLY